MSVRPAFFPKFRKVMNMIASDKEGERHNGADIAWKMCETEGISVNEACEGLGNSEVQAREIADLQKKLEKAIDDNRILSEDVMAFRNGEEAKTPEDALSEFKDRVLSFPQVRILIILIALGVREFLVWSMGGYESAKRDIVGDWALIKANFWWSVIDLTGWVLIGKLCVEWVRIEFWKRRRAGPVVVKSGLLLFASYVGTALFCGSANPEDWDGSTYNLFPSLIWLGIAAAATTGNLGGWIASAFCESEVPLFRSLRHWFG